MYTIFGNEEISSKDLLCYQLIEYFISALEKRKRESDSDEVALDHAFELNFIGKILHEKHISIYKDEYEPLIAKVDFTNSDVIDFCKRVSKRTSTEESKWWTERDFVFDGISCTEYMWPKDREICFTHRGPSKEKIHCSAFSIERVLGKKNLSSTEIQDFIEKQIKSCAKYVTNTDVCGGPHIHVIRIIGMPTLCAILGANSKMEVTTDFFNNVPSDLLVKKV